MADLKTLRLTAKDFKKGNSYWSVYIGKTDVSDYDGEHVAKDS
jgi:hypothetical protein